MLSMSEDDAAYTALLTQLLSDSATTRDARVHSWIEHQYDFVSEQLHRDDRNSYPCPTSGRPPSPSLFSSLGAHRTFSIDRPDSPLLPRFSSDWPVSPRSEPCPSYDALFFPSPNKPTEHEDLEERERARALRFLVQEMALWKPQNSSVTTLHSADKSLPAPPPSPVSSVETAITTPYASSPASPTTGTFDSPACSPENIALPSSPVEEFDFFRESLPTTGHDRTPSYARSIGSSSTAFPASPSVTSLTVFPPITNVFPASPVLSYFPAVHQGGTPPQPQHLRTPNSAQHSQSRWSVATTASLTPSTVEPKTGSFLHPTSPPKGKKDKHLKTPKKRARFISLISRLSPGRADTSTTTTSTADDVEYDSANESDNEDHKEKSKKKPISKKSSLASLRASFSISRTSFSSQRPPLASPIEEVPPLPISPARTSFNTSRPSLTEMMGSEVVPPVPKVSPSKIASWAIQPNDHLPAIPQTASTITSFQTSSQVSIPESLVTSVSGISLMSPTANQSTSRISLLHPPSKRTSLASAADIEPMMPTSQTPNRAKSIFRLTTKSKSPRSPMTSGIPPRAPASKLPKPGTSLPSPTSRIPPPTKFTPPAKLATVIAAQSQRVPPSPASPPASKLPSPPSRPLPSKLAPRAPLTITVEKTLAISSPAPSTPTASRLPMPALSKGTTRAATVKGFWRRQ